MISKRKKIVIIVGSASKHSANQKIINYLSERLGPAFELIVYSDLRIFPHFEPELSTNCPPLSIIELRTTIEHSDGVIICSPEYIFSIPSGLKNILEWCVATTIFNGKPTGLITASASGKEGHKELKLIMNTLMAKFTEETTLLIQGVKSKVDFDGNITDQVTEKELGTFLITFESLVTESNML
ncbi:NAD(P)H-dependent oxidoreductase [Flavihumibacter sp. RY-1]|uniref:NAD(P)H-dependent oxidoreductase n=1 Tax=Flavihumibacter fluminis TaxID=2909236 RepID=A0ABS9BDA4_9BACT|nr:NADPH-dependent FMN reductase [Flavihumibacter fluminis]MCF1713683.1 NAD(P)H-dependent oxidoreductase [Flavihumibacter fluminis]